MVGMDESSVQADSQPKYLALFEGHSRLSSVLHSSHKQGECSQ